MKKSIIFSLIATALVAFTFTSCKDDKNPSGGGGSETKITSLTVKPSTLILAVGETTRLAVLTKPEGANVAVEWSSSNTDVATVSTNGTVTAVGYGEATITAKHGDLSSTCQVSVKSEYETLSFTGSFIYDYDTTYSDKLDTLRSESWGDQYFVAKKVLCNVMVFTEGFYYGEEGLTGASKGGILEFEAPFYWAPKWANGGSGTIFVLGDWAISNEYPDSTDQVGRPASFDEVNFTNSINAFIQDYYIAEDKTKASMDLQKAATFVSGAKLTMFEYHTTEEGYASDGYFSSYIPDLYFGEGWLEFGGDYKASKYMCSVDAYQLQAQELKFASDTTTFEFYQNGAHFQETEEAINLLDSKVHFGESYKYEYNVPAKVAARKGAKQPRYIEMQVLSEDQKARLQEQLNRAKSIKVRK